MFNRKVTEVPLDLICTNPDQPRKSFQENELKELSESIKEYGVLQPIILKKDKFGLYILIAGERRLRAATLAGLTKIPAVIREADDKDSAIIALVENVQRENLNYMEEAYAYKNLMQEYGLTQIEIAQRVGKQQSTISNKIRLLALPPDIREVLATNQLSERHARALLKVEDDNLRKQVIGKIVAHGLNVKQSEKLIEDVLNKQEEEQRKKNKIRYISYKIYVNSLRKMFGEINAIEKNAKFYQEDKGEFVEVKIIIPKDVSRETLAL